MFLLEFLLDLSDPSAHKHPIHISHSCQQSQKSESQTQEVLRWRGNVKLADQKTKNNSTEQTPLF